MFRKSISAVIVLAMLSATATFSYTASDEIVNFEKATENKVNVVNQLFIDGSIEIFHPQDSLVTSYKTVLLSGKAPENSKVVVEVYSTANLLLKDDRINDVVLNNIQCLEKDSEDKNTFLSPVINEIEVGALGIFVEELELKIGLNKINVYIDGFKENAETRFVYVNDVTKPEELIESIDSIGIFDFYWQILNEEKTYGSVEPKE